MEIISGLPGQIVFIILFVSALVYFTGRMLARLHVEKFDKNQLDLGNLGPRFKRIFFEVLCQTKVIRGRPLVGLMHALVMWGFVAFSFATFNHMAIGFTGFQTTGFEIDGWYGAFVAVWSFLVLVGMAYLSYRRFIIRPKALGKLSLTSGLVAFFISILMLTYLLDWWGLENRDLIWALNWWAHTFSLLALLVIVPNSKHLHLLLAPIAIFLKPELPSTMRPLDIENDDLGLVEFKQLPWLDILQVNGCVECGRCTDVCPAQASGQTLDPKFIILDMQHGLLSGGKIIAGTTEEVSAGKAWIDEKNLFQCTTCGACTHECPVGIEHVGRKILDLRRGLVSEGKVNNDKVVKLFTTMEKAPHNPWGISQETRRKFVQKENFPIFDGNQEWLFWLGCGNGYDPHGQKVAVAMKDILNEAGVSWGVLENEICCGEPARRAGNEALFLTLSEQLTETFKGKGVKKIVSCCPHCTTMLDKDYRQIKDYSDLNITMLHHSQLINKLTAKLALSPEYSGTLTYHDPCYLARDRGVVSEPRQILRNCGYEVKEMTHCGSNTFCCGAGGAQLFIADDGNDEKGKDRINQIRFKEAEETGAGTIAVACPYCPIMLGDAAVRSGNQSVAILDLAEIVASRLKTNKKGGQ